MDMKLRSNLNQNSYVLNYMKLINIKDSLNRVI